MEMGLPQSLVGTEARLAPAARWGEVPPMFGTLILSGKWLIGWDIRGGFVVFVEKVYVVVKGRNINF